MGVKIQYANKLGDHIMKYSDFVQDQYGDHIGSVSLMGQDMQLCDHMQEIEGTYYATTFILNVTDRQMLKDQGARFGTLSDGSHAVYLTEALIAAATPIREGDEMTMAMMKRMVEGLQSANMKKHQKSA